MPKPVALGALVVMLGCAAPEVRSTESADPSAKPPLPATSSAAASSAAAASTGAIGLAAPPQPGDAGSPSPTEATGPAAPASDASPDGKAALGSKAALGGTALDSDVSAGAAGAFAADNKVKPPLESDELTDRARALFEAIVKNEPAIADVFWFPREPFIPLKDVKDPGKYWDNLRAVYANDIKALHRKRKSWEGARFVSFQIGSAPKWVPPGDEANKIGYYRSFYGKLRYEIDSKPASFEVHTVISWQGRWYITHLSKLKKT